MKTCKSIIWGIAFVVAGILLCLDAFEVINFDIFFDGWWTLFLIIPGFVGMFADEHKISHGVLLLVGVLLLLACQDVISFSILGKLALPIVITTIGVSLLCSNMFNQKLRKTIDEVNAGSKAQGEYNAIFSGQDVKLDKEEFKGTNINATFGGIKLDLRDAKIKEDVVITCRAIFGGIDLIMPSNVKVKVKSNSVFGGVENQYTNEEGKVTVYVDATCVFGGIDIK